MEEKEKIVIISILNILLALAFLSWIWSIYLQYFSNGIFRVYPPLVYVWLILNSFLLSSGIFGIAIKKYLKTHIFLLIIFLIFLIFNSFMMFFGSVFFPGGILSHLGVWARAK